MADFARDYPEDAELAALVLLFDQGNYREVRARAARLLASDKPADVKAAARDLVARTEPSRAQVFLLLLATLLVAALSVYEVVQHHARRGVTSTETR